MPRVIDEIRSPLTGSVATILVEDGTAVEAGDPVVEIEAMKMFTLIEAPCAGTVRMVCEVGEVVGEDDLLAEIEEA